VFWVISVYFNIRNTLPKSGTFLLGHPVYILKYFISAPTCFSESVTSSGSLNFVLAKVTIIFFLNYSSIKAVHCCLIKSININKMWKLFGGCMYSLEFCNELI